MPEITCKKCKYAFSDTFKFCPMCGRAVAEKERKRRQRANGEGAVIKRGKTYSIRITTGWKLVDGRAVQKFAEKGGFKTQREALEYAPTLRADASRPKGVDYSKILFRELYDKFIERHAKRVSRSTLNCYTSAYKYYDDLYDIPFADLNTEDWQLCIDDCPKGIRTKQNMKALGTLMYKLAAELRVFGVNTKTDFASLVWLGKDDTESRQPFTSEELEKIKKAVANGVPYADWILSMCYTGFRPSEFLALRKDAFDAEQWTLRGGAKTDAGKNRIVPIHPRIRPIIAQRMLMSGEFIFADPSGAPFTINHFREACFYPALAAAGIQPVPDGTFKPDRTPYSTRHTFATLMKGVTGADKDKAALMGHTSYEMTMHYQHEDYESLRKIIESIA